MSIWTQIPPAGGGGGGAVDSVNGQTGVVVLTKSSIGLGNVNNTSDANKPVSTAQAAADTAAVATAEAFSIQRANHTGVQDIATVTSATFNAVLGTSAIGVAEPVPDWSVDPASGGFYTNIDQSPNNLALNLNIHRDYLNITPLQNSPNDSINIKNTGVTIDPSSSGFTFGTAGDAVRLFTNNINLSGTSTIGGVAFTSNTFTLGNGTDPVSIKGFSYAYGFGQVSAAATVNGPMQGYGFQPNFNSGSFATTSAYVNAFYDAAYLDMTLNAGYNSFTTGPYIKTIANNASYSAFNANGTVDTFLGNASYTGLGISPTLGTFVGGSFNGISINPTITSAITATGISVYMDNVTVYPGVAASVVVQDLTFTAITPGAGGNAATVEYTGGGTAGAEVVSQAGLAYTVQIQSGVSTATQIKAAVDAFPGFFTNITTTISGAGGNAQTTQGPVNLAGGVDPGNKKAAYFDGDVEITGSLTFGGALSIGKLSAFATQALVDTGGNPQSIHSLITQPTVAANAVLTSADLLGINTAMLLTIGDNATVGTSFVGAAALGLPAVVSMGTGSTLDRCYGALFALSLDASATGGTIAELAMCKSVAIPNGATSVTNLYGYLYELPFGDPGVTSWGFYARTASHNYFAGDLKIGGGTDVVDPGLTLHVEGDTKLEGNLEVTADIGFFSTIPVSQQPSSGAATAGAVYTGTEQTMIQEMYDALRAYGLLT